MTTGRINQVTTVTEGHEPPRSNRLRRPVYPRRRTKAHDHITEIAIAVRILNQQVTRWAGRNVTETTLLAPTHCFPTFCASQCHTQGPQTTSTGRRRRPQSI